jgi:hypothetical protein
MNDIGVKKWGIEGEGDCVVGQVLVWEKKGIKEEMREGWDL